MGKHRRRKINFKVEANQRPMPWLFPYGWQKWLLTGAALLPFLTVLRNGYAYDDVPIVRNNPLVHSLFHFFKIFTSDYWEPVRKGGLYRPFTIMSFALEWAFSPHNPAFYHLVNLATELIVVFLIYALCLRLYLSEFTALAGAIWFALNPMHVEVIAGLVGLSDILALGFTLATLLLIPRDDKIPKHIMSDSVKDKGLGRNIGLFSLTLAALLSKESAIALPGFALLVLWFEGSHVGALPEHDLRIRSTLRNFLSPIKTPAFWVISASVMVYLAIRIYIVGLMVSHITFEANPLAFAGTLTRIRTAAVVDAQSFLALLWPFRLAPDYSYPQIPLQYSWFAPTVIFSFVFIALSWLLLIWLSIRIWSGKQQDKIMKAVWFSGLFCWFGFLPVSNLVFVIGTIRGNRLMYLPSVGVAILAGVMVEMIWKKMHPTESNDVRPVENCRRIWQALLAFSLLYAVVFAVTDLHDSGYWKNNLKLFAMAIRRSPRSSYAHYGLGAELMRHKEYTRARRQFEQVLRLDPRFNVAGYELARIDQAIGNISKALPWALWAFHHKSTSHNFDLVADIELARHHYSWILKEGHKLPLGSDATAQLALGLARLWSGHPQSSLVFFKRATEISPGNLRIQHYYSQALKVAHQGKFIDSQ